MNKKIIGSLIAVVVLVGGFLIMNPVKVYDGSIGFVTDKGGVHDGSFNEASFTALKDFSESNNYKFNYIETHEDSQMVNNLNAMAEQSEVVVASGFLFEEALFESAKAHPEINYVGIDASPMNKDGEYVKLPNVQTFKFYEQDSGYLSGYVAGKTTKTNKLGVIGGIEVPAVLNFEKGFEAGVKKANPNATVEIINVGSFDDVAKGKTTAQAMLSKDIDVIMTAAGGVNAGAIEAIKEARNNGEEVWAVGVDKDMFEDGVYNADGDSVILTSAMKMVNQGAIDGVTNHFKNEFKGGTTTLGLKEQGVGLPVKNANVTDELVKEAYDNFEEIR